MSRKIYFLSGLPRSGSTLLAALLSQNPAIHATETSGLVEVMFLLRNQWDGLEQHRAISGELSNQRRQNTLRAILEHYHDDQPKPILVDKSRAWLAHLEMIDALIGPPKVIVTVRDIRDVLASFERLWRENGLRQTPQERDNYANFQTVEQRCKVWVAADQPLGIAYNRIKDALARGWGRQIHFVPFERLTADAAQTLCGIYSFLGETPFEHDFESVINPTIEDDRVYGIEGLHVIRPGVRPVAPQWPKYLGHEVAEAYRGAELW